jgi:hypothetical protein
MNMKRILTSAVALVIVATSFPSAASARDWHRGYHHHRGDGVAAGVVGLALGAVLGAAITDSSHRRYYDRRYDRCYDRCGYYHEGYYEDGYYDGYGRPDLCIVRERRWDPYRGREIYMEERRPC